MTAPACGDSSPTPPSRAQAAKSPGDMRPCRSPRRSRPVSRGCRRQRNLPRRFRRCPPRLPFSPRVGLRYSAPSPGWRAGLPANRQARPTRSPALHRAACRSGGTARFPGTAHRRRACRTRPRKRPPESGVLRTAPGQPAPDTRGDGHRRRGRPRATARTDWRADAPQHLAAERARRTHARRPRPCFRCRAGGHRPQPSAGAGFRGARQGLAPGRRAAPGQTPRGNRTRRGTGGRPPHAHGKRQAPLWRQPGPGQGQRSGPFSPTPSRFRPRRPPGRRKKARAPRRAAASASPARNCRQGPESPRWSLSAGPGAVPAISRRVAVRSRSRAAPAPRRTRSCFPA